MEGLESQAKEFKILLGSSRSHRRFLSLLIMKPSWSFRKIALVMAHRVPRNARRDRRELGAPPCLGSPCLPSHPQPSAFALRML